LFSVSMNESGELISKSAFIYLFRRIKNGVE
jgi:hypothetical protein